jgi:hypothetical protein
MITVKLEGMAALQARLTGLQRQIPFAASKALNNVAFKVNAEVKDEMKRTFKGGATAFALQSFRVEKASKQSLLATIGLRKDGRYEKAFSHLFTGGTRQWKKLEGFMRSSGMLPSGYMVVPGEQCPLDARGNLKRQQLSEMLGVLKSSIRNLRIDYTRARDYNQNKNAKLIGFFVIPPGAKSHLHPGIYRRIEQGSYRSHVQPYIMFVKPGKWRRFIDLKAIGEKVVSQHWQTEFDRELSKAMRSSR